MSSKKSKKFFIIGGIIILVLLGAWLFVDKSSKSIFFYKDPYRMEVITLPDSTGYGYEIYVQDQRTIYQPHIPGATGKKPFQSMEDAAKVAELVIQRMKSGEFISITVRDLDALGVIY